MTFGPNSTISSYLPIEFDIPDDEKLSRELISKRERLTSSIVNIKENGNYETFEILTAQQWFNPTNSAVGSFQVKRYTFRKVIDFGTLPNTGTKSVAHGIPVNDNYIFTRIYGTATNKTFWIPLPYVNSAAKNADIELSVDATNVNITTGINRTDYTQCYIVLEYIKG